MHDGGMSEHETPEQTPEQLSLLPSSDVPVRLRLDLATRRRGLQHIAEIRQQLAARQAARATVEQIPARAPIRSNAA